MAGIEQPSLEVNLKLSHNHSVSNITSEENKAMISGVVAQPHESKSEPFVTIIQPPCQWILYADLGNSGYVFHSLFHAHIHLTLKQFDTV